MDDLWLSFMQGELEDSPYSLIATYVPPSLVAYHLIIGVGNWLLPMTLPSQFKDCLITALIDVLRTYLMDLTELQYLTLMWALKMWDCSGLYGTTHLLSTTPVCLVTENPPCPSGLRPYSG